MRTMIGITRADVMNAITIARTMIVRNMSEL